jgi:predicted nicotinamide N-methyase
VESCDATLHLFGSAVAKASAHHREALQASLSEQLVRLRGDAPGALTDVLLDRLELAGGSVLRARPRSFDDVREAEALAGRRRPTPYWASAWPSGTVLAQAVAERDDLRGRRVVELGCGIGMPSVAAARGGAEVLATDASAEAVVYAAHNLALNGLQGDVAVATWDDLEALGGPWDLVLGADVLYLQANAEQLAALLPHVVAPGGEAWIADPGRSGCKDFLARVRRRWRLDSTGGAVRVHRLRRRARFT